MTRPTWALLENDHVSVRVARIEDAPAIARLLAELGYAPSDSLIADKLRQFAQSEGDDVFLAIRGARIIGCISLHVHELFHAHGRLGRITSLLVESSARNQGVGHVLVGRADSYFRSAGCIRAEVTSGDHRPEAHLFYVRNGYLADERRFVKRL
jgi:N-acetylglutamate synthase-like GNAT family acetyltransferase